MAPFKHFLVFLMIIASTYCRPPRQKVTEHHETPEVKQGGDHAPAGNGSEQWDLGIEYNRYLQEVVQVLESDPEFRKKLEDSDVEKIRDGSIAEELKFVDHNLRTKLDDVKRKEVDRLRKLAVKQYEKHNGIDRQNLKMPGHIDVSNHRFDVEDLKKLIKSTTNDLEEADKKRRDDFKKYEMEKKFEKEERLRHIGDEEAREKERQKLADQEKKHKDHEKLNHPMTKDQLEEVWEEQDHMQPEDWDPKTFFAMHDLNGDGFWEEDELKVLFQKELDKAYDPNAPEDDMKERAEESERMREHVLKETDRNKDRMISLEEFLTQTKEDEFNNHEAWEGLDEEDPEYTDEEFKQFEQQRQAEIQAMIAQGLVPPGYPYYGDVPPGAIPHPGAVPPPNGQFQPHLGVQGHPGVPGQVQYQVPQGMQQGQQQFQHNQGQQQFQPNQGIAQPHQGVQQAQQGVRGQPVHNPNLHGQPVQGSPQVNMPIPNQPAANVNVGSNTAQNAAGQNVKTAQASQYQHQNINALPSNNQVPQGNIQNGGSPPVGQFQPANTGQQMNGNQQAGQLNHPSQNQQQANPNIQYQNAPSVQQHANP